MMKQIELAELSEKKSVREIVICLCLERKGDRGKNNVNESWYLIHTHTIQI